MNPKLIVEILLKVLADRALLFLTLILNFALFSYAVYSPDYLRFATAGLFSITVFIPVLSKHSSDGNRQQQEREAA